MPFIFLEDYKGSGQMSVLSDQLLLPLRADK
jgi:hypothetical protein